MLPTPLDLPVPLVRVVMYRHYSIDLDLISSSFTGHIGLTKSWGRVKGKKWGPY